MIKPQDIYVKFLLKVNKNDTNKNIKISKEIFVIIFNEQQRKFASSEELQELLLLDEELVKKKEYTNKVDFVLPLNFNKRVGGYVVASKDECKKVPLIVWFVNPLNKDVLVQNSMQSPSFEYRETLGVINSDKVSIYKNDFAVNNMYLSYYFLPTEIDIRGYIDLDGNQSKDTMTELSIDNIDKVIDRCVVEVAQNYEDINKMNMALQRQKLNEK